MKTMLIKKCLRNKYYLGRDTGASSASDKLMEGNTIYYYEGNTNGATGNQNKLIDAVNLKFPGFRSFIKNNKFLHAIAIVDYDIKNIKENSKGSDIYKDVEYLIKLGYKKIRPPKRKGGLLGRWTWLLETFKKNWNNDRVFIKNQKNIIKKEFVDISNTYIKNGQRFLKKVNRLPIQNILYNFSSAQGTIQLSSEKAGIIPACKFSNPKNVEMIKFLIRAYNKKDAVVLDFFAGSGTTGQAVLELNKEDGGNRKFILCVNESGDSDTICKERLKRVMTGKTSEGKSDFPWIKNNKPLGSSLNIYGIKEASIYSNETSLLNIVDETDYDLPKFKTEIEKIEWVTENFKITTMSLSKK